MTIAKLCMQKGVGFIYLIGFLVAWNQFKALCGESGLLPIQLYLKGKKFKSCPSLFIFCHKDGFTKLTSGIGIALSLFAIFGASSCNIWIYMGTWFLMWILYSSFVNVGQIFYSFGWETMLLEMGFLCIFLGPSTIHTPYTTFILFQWLLFRNMFGAGLIKLRGDECWHKLTCLYYHFETQPIPNLLSRLAHNLPKGLLRGGVRCNHFVEVIIPFFYFVPGPFAWIAGGCTCLFQFMLILTGNFSWLNYITLIQCFACFSDPLFHFVGLSPIQTQDSSYYFLGLSLALLALVIFLSRSPVRNLFSKGQVMNCSFENFHIVNTYGAFGSITRPRYEIIIEGTSDDIHAVETPRWTAYEFKAKPGNLKKKPRIIAPYHLRIDWLMWFAAMSSHTQHPWIVHLVYKLLHNDKKILALLDKSPFENSAPKYIRIQRYVYRFATPAPKKSNYWERDYFGEYLPPISLDNQDLKKYINTYGWDKPLSSS